MSCLRNLRAFHYRCTTWKEVKPSSQVFSGIDDSLTPRNRPPYGKDPLEIKDGSEL